MSNDPSLETLVAFLQRVPGVTGSIGRDRFEDGRWWVKCSIDIDHRLAWNVVQEHGCVLNYLSINERLPTIFMPVSPAPYLNGGPGDYLPWVIESRDPMFDPDLCTKWLENRLPQPVDDESAWPADMNDR